jgi:PAS domain S-box-containing protein
VKRGKFTVEKEMKEFHGEIGKAEVKEPNWDSKAALPAILDSLSAHVVTLDRQGRVNYASRSWFEFARENGGDWVGIGLGADYLAACRAAAQQGDPLAQRALDGIEAVLAGRLARISLEYPCHEPRGRHRWFLMNVDPLPEDPGGVVISHIDITERKQMESALAERDAKFRGIYESNMVPVAFWNLDGCITNANDAYLRLIGYTRAELDERSLHCSHPTPPDELHLDKQAIQEAIARGVCTPYEKHYIRRDGRRIPVLIGGGMLPGMPNRGVVFAIDLTERKKTEEKLRESEEKNRAILQALPDLMFVQSKDGIYLDCHAKDPKALLVEPEKFLGKNMSEVLPPELGQAFARCFELVVQSSEPVIHEYSLPIQGEQRNYEARMVRHNGDKILSVVRDITERKQAEQALGESQARLKAVMDNCPAIIFLKDSEGRYLYANPKFGDISHRSDTEIIGKTDFEIFPHEQAAIFRAHDLKVLDAGVPLQFEGVALHDDGPHTSVVYKFPLFDAGGKIYATGGIGTDITERERAEEALRQSEERYRNVVETQTELICRNLPDTTLTFVNDAYCRYFGKTREQLIGMKFLELIPEPVRPAVFEHIEALVKNPSIGTSEHEHQVLNPDGSIGWQHWTNHVLFDSSGSVAELQGIGKDITERKQGEQALQDLVAGTAVTGKEFFPAYVRHVAAALDVHCATVAELADDQNSRLRTLAVWVGTGWAENYEYEVTHVPCGQVVREGKLFYCRERVQEMFPQCSSLADLNAVSYMGAPLFNSAGQLIGNLCIIDDKRLNDEQRAKSIMEIFAARAAAEIERKRAEDSLRKSEEELKQALTEVQRLKERLEAENVYLRREVSEAYRDREIIGRSEGIHKVLRQVNQVAETDMTVLVLGETGTGKELVARAVHGQSGRSERPLVKVNCSALPGELIESELFGHEKGAFTGATGRQVGRFELADGGTIFLDEVGDLPLKLQSKLLRVLQEGEFERLGSGKTIKVDVRVIAATNRNLVEGMQRGSFRPDLYYRLAVYPIGLPPLRERREDIGLLAEVFLREASRRLGRLFDPISEEVLEALRRYEWPGNIRELQNVIERAAVVSIGRWFQLPEGWASSEAWKPATTGSVPPLGGEQLHKNDDRPLEEGSLDEVGKNYIVQILQQTGWRVEGPKGAARILGLNPSTLRSRMLKLGIRRPSRSRAETQE